MKKIRRYKNEQFEKLANVKAEFKAETSNDVTDITIYGDIGESWWGDSISASDIEKTLKNVTASTINLHLNSGGGDVFDGIAIYNQLKNHSAKVIVHVEGLAASAASLFPMAADEVIIYTGAMVMIHEASTMAFGTKTDIQKTLNALDGIDKSLADIYMTKYAGDRSEIETMIKNETWFTADEAVEIGFADKVNNEVVEDEVSAEDFKNSVLARFRKNNQQTQVAATANKNILEKFKRQA